VLACSSSFLPGCSVGVVVHHSPVAGDTGLASLAAPTPQACGAHVAEAFGAQPSNCEISLGFHQVLTEGETWEGGQDPPEDGSCLLWDGQHPQEPDGLVRGEAVYLDLGDSVQLLGGDESFSLVDAGPHAGGGPCGDHIVQDCATADFPFGQVMDLSWSGGEGEHMLPPATLAAGVAFPSQPILVLPGGAEGASLSHPRSEDLSLAWFLEENVPWLEEDGGDGESHFGEDVFIHRMGPHRELREQLWCRPVHGEWGFDVEASWLDALGSLGPDESFTLDVRFNWEYWPDDVVVPGTEEPMRIVGQYTILGALELDD